MASREPRKLYANIQFEKIIAVLMSRIYVALLEPFTDIWIQTVEQHM